MDDNAEVLLSKETVVSPSQLLKAEVSIVVTVEGSMTLERASLS